MNRPPQLEKQELDVGFIPILCATPLILAHARGTFEKYGLRVNLRVAPGWSGIKELMAYGKLDAAHMLSPMPLACNVGIDGKKGELELALIQNVNGQALTLAAKHQGLSRAEDMKGFTFGVPYRFSMHYYLLCHYLAMHGIDPINDATIIEVAPPNMPSYLEQGWVDGIFAPEPFNQIPVMYGTGFIHILSKDIWPGHPCCGFVTTREFAETCPNTHSALIRCIIEAEQILHTATPDERRTIARNISDAEHLDLDTSLPAEQVLSGEFPDGRGGNHRVADRIDFVPTPFAEYGHWMLSQMQRWGQLRERIDYQRVVETTFAGGEVCELASAVSCRGWDHSSAHHIGFGDIDPFTYMRGQPFSCFEEAPTGRPQREIPAPIERRILEINSRLADVVGGKLDAQFEVMAPDELGRLEELLGELVLNTKFSRLLLSERNNRLRLSTAELRLRQQELRTTTETLSAVLDGIDDLIYVADPDTYQLLHVNEAFKRVCGERVIGRNCHTVLHGRDEPCPFCTNNRIFGEQLGKSHTWEHRNELTQRWYRCTDKAIRWVDDRMVRFEMASDITALKATQQALGDEEAKVRAFLDNTADLVTVVDSKGAFRYVNRVSVKYFGLSPEEALGRSAFDFIHADDRESTLRAFSSWIEQGLTEACCENRQCSLTGAVHDIQWTIMPRYVNGELESVWSIGHDTTEQKRAVAALNENKMRLQMSLDAAQAGVWSCNIADESMRWDQRMADLHGLEPEAFAGTYEGWVRTVHPRDVHIVQGAMRSAMEGMASYDIEYRVRAGDDDWRVINAQAVVVKDKLNRPSKMVGVCRDITAQKEAVARLARTKDNLKRSNRELEQFAYVASHDLQEPLRMVASYTQLLANRYEGQLDEKADKYIGYAVEGATRMQGLINDLLAFSRVGRRKEPMEVIDCQELLEQVLKGLEQAVAESGAEISVGALPTIQADRTQMGQVFQNLIANAIKFHGADPPKITVTSRRKGSAWEMTIADNGIGIDPQFHERIFVIFQRLHERGKHPGSGIGLAIVKKIVQRHGGQIMIDSALGRGTRFTFTVPALEQQGGRAMGERFTILLVEDNPADADLTMETLQASKILCDLHVAIDGIEAMDFLQRRGKHADAPRPDLVLLDLNLPRMDGREVLSEMKDDKTLRRIPVVVLTSSQAEEDVVKSYDLHASAYVTKPVDLPGFGKIVRGIEEFWLSVVRFPSEKP